MSRVGRRAMKQSHRGGTKRASDNADGGDSTTHLESANEFAMLGGVGVPQNIEIVGMIDSAYAYKNSGSHMLQDKRNSKPIIVSDRENVQGDPITNIEVCQAQAT